MNGGQAQVTTAVTIVPLGEERALDLDVPPALQGRWADETEAARLDLFYVAGSEVIAAASHEVPAGTPRPLRIRKRLPPPPEGLTALRFAITGAAPVDLPAQAPPLADYARGGIALGEVPALIVGETAALPLTVTNESSFDWGSDVAVRVDFEGEAQLVPLPAVVPAGTTRAVEVPIAVPQVAGERTLLVTLVLHPTLPFARGRTFRPARRGVTVARTRPDPAQPRCRIEVTPPGTTLIAGEPGMLDVTVTNTGDTRIEASGTGCLRLRARWQRETRGSSPTRDTAFRLLPHALEPGETARVALEHAPPGAAGRYALDVLAELVGTGMRLDRTHCTCAKVTIEVCAADALDRAEERALRASIVAASTSAADAAYRAWAARCDTIDDAAGALGLAGWPRHPRICVMLAEPDADAAAWLAEQPYPNWSLGEPAAPAPDDLILCWNPRQARLADHTLAFLAGAFVRDPARDIAYGDFDHLDAAGARRGRVFLPPPDPFFARSQPAVATIAMVRRSALAAAGLAADDPNAAARLLADPHIRAAHLPYVLLHRRAGDEIHHPAAVEDGWRIAAMHDAPGRAVRAILPDPPPRVALIVTTRDRHDLLATCINSLLDRTDYPAFDLIVIDNGSVEAETLAYMAWLAAAGLARVIRDDGDFNWARLNNLGAAATGADILCFLNNDMEVISERWLHELAALAARADVGVAGATLWFPDGTVQHAGVAFTADGAPLHLFHGAPRGSTPFYLRALRGQPAVTGACLAVRRGVFARVGGFDEIFPVGFNDIDFCLRVRESTGLPTVITPRAELLHHESATRGRLRGAAELAYHLRELAQMEGRHLETMLTDGWSRAVAEAARPNIPATMVARAPDGARAVARRLRRIGTTPLAFLHIPRTGASAARAALARALPDRAMLSIGARAIVKGHAGDPATAARLLPLLREAEVLFAPVSHGFGAAVGWPCRYATILRDPVARVRSHHRLLVDAVNAPLRETPLAGWPLAMLLRKGVIPGNLMLSRILGEPPETVGWEAIDGRFPRYAGFRLPPALWAGDIAALETLPDMLPDGDHARVARALSIIERDFLFVGLQDQLAAHLAQLASRLDLASPGAVPRVNAAAEAAALDQDDHAAAEAYNALDRMLYDAIAARPGGLFLA